MCCWTEIWTTIIVITLFIFNYVAAETLNVKPPLLQETPLDKLQILNETGIVPNILEKPPLHVLFGDYDGKEISWGNIFKPEDIKKRPHYLDWPVLGTKSLYCLIMSGLDAPNKEEPTLSEWRHWLVGNIPGTDIEKGEEILSYNGAGNYYDEGQHRIAFFVFKQPGKRKIKFYERILRKVKPIYKQRGNFSTKMFARKYSLQQAVAANFITVDCDKPKATTDYYAHTIREVPPDWQGIELHPRDFGFTFDLPGYTLPPEDKTTLSKKNTYSREPLTNEANTSQPSEQPSVDQSTAKELLTEKGLTERIIKTQSSADSHATSQPQTVQESLTDHPSIRS